MAIPRVLLVDDQRQVTRMLRPSLELSGRAYDIVDVRSAEEALGEMDRGPVDLVVTDLRLPEMSGLERIARIRPPHPGVRGVLGAGPGDASGRSAGARPGRGGLYSQTGQHHPLPESGRSGFDGGGDRTAGARERGRKGAGGGTVGKQC